LQHVGIVELVATADCPTDGPQLQGAKAVRERGVLPGSMLGIAHRVMLDVVRLRDGHGISLLWSGRVHGPTRLPCEKAPRMVYGLVNKDADPTPETTLGPGDRLCYASLTSDAGYVALYSTTSSTREQSQP
jgi:hypothetical protein